jgi:hypothetical protein
MLIFPITSLHRKENHSMSKKSMSKKFLLVSLFFVFFGIANTSMGNGHGPEAWKDNEGHLAPSKVRRAADTLWNAVEAEGSAAFDAGWGVGKKMPCGPKRVCLNICTCGLVECMMATCGEYDEFGYSTRAQAYPNAYEAKQMIYAERTREVMTALAEFKEAVNQYVANPEQYSGDANVCELGPWVEDNAWHINDMFVSGRRDLSDVTRTTKDFVNAHGGWVNDYGT